MKKISMVLLVLLLAIFGACKKKTGLKNQPYLQAFNHLEDDVLGLVFSSSVEGYVEPCGCTSEPLGGLARFAQVFLEIKAKLNNRITLIDTGNLLFESTSRNSADLCQDNARINLLLSTMTRLGLNLSYPGPLDEARGKKYRQDLYKQYGILEQDFDAPKIIKTKKYDIAIIGINNSSPTNKIFLQSTLQILKKEKNIKFIAAISHLELSESTTFFYDMSNIDVVFQARLQNMDPKPPTSLGALGPLLIEGGRQGQYLNILLLRNLNARSLQKLELDTREFEQNERIDLLKHRILGLNTQKNQITKQKLNFIEQRISLAQNELADIEKEDVNAKVLTNPNILFKSVALSKKINSDSKTNILLKQYEKNIPKLVEDCEKNTLCEVPKDGSPTFVGAKTCKSCHQEAFDVWQKAVFVGEGRNELGETVKRNIGHSKAWKTLVDVDKDSDRSCIGCHSIGFMEPGGYCKVSQVDFRINVQCESCHGPGSLHAKSGGNKKLIDREVKEETCRKCHQVPHIKNFDSFNYQDSVQKILGKGHGEKLLRQLQHKPQSE